MLKRILVAIPIVVLVALAVFIQSWVLAIFVVILGVMCQYEVVRALDGNGKPVVKAVSYAFAIILAWLFLCSNHFVSDLGLEPLLTVQWVMMLFIACVMATFIAAMFTKRHTAESILNTILTLVYPQLIFALFYLMLLDAHVNLHVYSNLRDMAVYYNIMLLLFLVFLPAMFSDTFAYFFGMAFGKKKLCPSISPKKTVVGCVAGIVGGVLAGVLIWLVFENMLTISGQKVLVGSLPNFIIKGGVLAAISQFGDLSASYLKRMVGIKDFGKLLPGHGGVVDRMDSILFCIPTLYILNFIIF
ncbi:phosphatidate cytidylyltransferase [Christensenellaceae bacterium OttesenSCG-928-K19]|nr:phosphatidate cytidylyltransferase [Christensenellaceae bacterium OttesenSCG-928-K19]